jgi:CRP-like cAMP-binding protein
MDRCPSLRQRLLRFAHVFSVQCGATAVANAHGTIEERLARWLLMALDRHDGASLPLTHEFMAVMLGVRRAGVTLALQHLEAKGLVQATRGRVTISDRDGLRERANGLYGAPEAEYERLIPPTS